jgi:glycosyltransferase involved in cell wall biosynthesis
MDDVTFHVAGNGPKQKRLTEEAPANVEFHGKVTQSEMPSFYANADVYFQPSRWEGLCMTVVEAMACGRPVVGSAVGGITESVVDGETGFLCPPRDVECFVEQIERLADAPNRREAMGTAGRQRVLEQYSATALGDGFRRAIDQARTESDERATASGPP